VKRILYRVVSWCITPIFLLNFFGLLVVCHLLQVIARLFSRTLQKDALDLMNLGIILNVRFVGFAHFKVKGDPNGTPNDRSVIVVANHQSMYDIPMIMWYMRARELGFIAKRELARGIPSISLALRTLGSVIIDRKDTRGSIRAIEGFGRVKEEAKQVACIFPEGTRARDGVMKRFKLSGFQTLLQSMPTAIIQPVVIEGNWELLQYKFLPVPVGTHITLSFLEPIEQEGRSAEDLLLTVERSIRSVVEGSSPKLEISPTLD